MELVRMRLADLRPNPANLRTEVDGIEELADLLELTPGAPGEPMIPLIAMRDANVGRIVDGHRRYFAMKERGKVDGCNVLMCDDLDDRERAEKLIMLLSDAHEELPAEDFSKGLQEVMLLGLPEDDVDKIARRKGTGRALRRAIEGNGGKAEQVTIDRVLAAQSVIDAGGTDEDYADVMESDNFAFRRDSIVRNIEAERKRAELEEAIAEVVERFGLVVADKKPKGAPFRTTVWQPKPDYVRNEWPTLAAAGCTVVRPKPGFSSWEIYDKAKEVTAEEEEALKSKNKLRRMRTAGEKKRAEWLYAKLSEGGGRMAGMPSVQALVEGFYDGDRFDLDARDFLRRAGVAEGDNALPLVANAWMCAYKWCVIDHIGNIECDLIHEGEIGGYSTKVIVERHVKVMRALERDRYEMDDDEAGFLKLCEKRLAELHARERAK